MTLTEVIKELQEMQEWTDAVSIANGSFRLHEIERLNTTIEMYRSYR